MADQEVNQMTVQQTEVDQNYEEFRKLLPTLLPVHANKFALMQDRKILGFYSTSQDAMSAAESFLAGKLYSVQRVTDSAVDLGFFSHAMHIRNVQPSGRSADPVGGATL